MPSVMSVSVHCMRLAASYDTLTEGKLRYRLAQSHTLTPYAASGLPMAISCSTDFLYHRSIKQ